MSTNDQTSTAASQADQRRLEVSPLLDVNRRADLGQYLTPVGIARFMASMFESLPDQVRVLDAGAGTGTLTAAFVEDATARPTRPREIAATAFEVDSQMLGHLAETLKQCEADCASHGVRFTSEIRDTDFIQTAAENLGGDLFRGQPMLFDAAILNPPYRKIGTFSDERYFLQSVGLDATNLYAAFVALAIRLLKREGQLVVIMPRSFCNGPYFRPFRDQLFGETAIRRIHVFESRKEAFQDDGVLQENIILSLVKGRPAGKTILVSTGNGEASLKVREVPYAEVVREANGDHFIHLPTSQADSDVASWMAELPSTLQSLGIGVSTGRVVDFRAREFLQHDPGPATVPLIYPCHISTGTVEWPLSPSRKPNAISDSEGSASLLVPSGYYVLTKRFTSKEERRRVVAAVYDPTQFAFDRVGFENHVNYFHAKGKGLEREFAFGLKLFLNSSMVDNYFRQFNGHTQVNATDLRTLRYPDRATLISLGIEGLAGRASTQEAIDALMGEFLVRPSSGPRITSPALG